MRELVKLYDIVEYTSKYPAFTLDDSFYVIKLYHTPSEKEEFEMFLLDYILELKKIAF